MTDPKRSAPGQIRRWGFIATLLVAITGCADSEGNPPTDDPFGEAPASQTDVERSDVEGSIEGIDSVLVNSVAPYEHHSNVDSTLFEMRLTRLNMGLLSACLRDDGFEPPVIPPLPDRSAASLAANERFPFVERLEAEGLPSTVQEGKAVLDPLPPEPDLDYQDASQRCAEAIRSGPGQQSAEIYELWASARGAWENELEAINGLDQVRELRGEFTSCLIQSGISPRDAASEKDFLFSVDDQIRNAVSDNDVSTIFQDSGQLFARCGKPLFSKLEKIRSGPRREAFLTTHEVTLQTIADLLGAFDED